MRIKQNTLTVNKISKKQECFQLRKYHYQWSQILSGAVCVVGFMIIFSFMLILTVNEHNESRTKSNINEKNIDAQKCKVQTCLECECRIKCDGLQQTDNISYLVEMEYKKLDQQTCGRTIRHLVLNIFSINNHTIKQKWLQSTLFKVKSLQIVGNNNQEINIVSGAFDGDVFHDVEILTFNTLTINEWESDFLIGMPILNTLNLWACNVKNIHEDALKPVSGILKTLQINEMKRSWDPMNMTGSINLGSISIVDFRYNSFSVKLNSKSFAGISRCESLYLDRSNIDKIEEGTFLKLSNMGRLNLVQNKLTTLKENVFGNIRKDLSIYIDDNDWNCSCDLQWLKQYQENNIVYGDPTCTSPSHAANKNFSLVDFCADTTGPGDNCTDPSTTSENPETSLIPNENIIELFCTILSPEAYENVNIKRKLFSIDNHENKNPIEEAEYVINEIPKPTVDFTISDEGSGTVYIDIFSELFPNDLLIWFNKKVGLLDVINKSQSIGCATRLASNVPVDNLNIGETYSFCFLQEGETKISPLNCRAHIVEKPWGMQTWLSNEERPLIISTVGLGLILCCLLGAFLVYLLIRRNPSLLRGSKRVVMVKNNKTEALVLPSKYVDDNLNKKMQDFEMSRRVHSQRPSFRRAPMRRSVSETSIVSSRSIDASYISAAEPTTVQLLNWRLERLRNRMATESCIKEIPPPLPATPTKITERPQSPGLPIDLDSISSISEI